MSNNTKIKYLSVQDKLYVVTDISFLYFHIEAVETDMMVGDVPADETWDIEEFKDYKITLINNGGEAKIVDFNEWLQKRN